MTMDYNARDYVSSTFIRKEDLRTGGPQRHTVKAVEEADGLPGRNGTPARKELVLVFNDGSRASLRTQTNLKKMLERYGEKTSRWIGQPVELFYSPDIPNPGGGAPGGIRIRFPESATVPRRFSSDLEELEGATEIDLDEGAIEPIRPQTTKPKGSTRRAPGGSAA
jgi:hypothetical protein